ncbi:trypsin-like peptidase domain-containing protein [Streptacidiphilus monticola]
MAQPQAPGQAVALGAPGSTLPEDPTYLTVELTSGQSSPAVAKYRAKPVAVDGYRDLAVVRIYADAAGRPVDPASLSLPSLRIGSTAALKLGQPLTVLGFPGCPSRSRSRSPPACCPPSFPTRCTMCRASASSWRRPPASPTATPVARPWTPPGC